MAYALAAELFAEICKIPCVNSHSHLLPERVRLRQTVDALTFLGETYPRADLLAAGMPLAALDKALDPDLPMQERWRVIEPYWKVIRLTGYAQ